MQSRPCSLSHTAASRAITITLRVQVSFLCCMKILFLPYTLTISPQDTHEIKLSPTMRVLTLLQDLVGLIFLAILFAPLGVLSGCDTPGFVPCPPNGSGSESGGTSGGISSGPGPVLGGGGIGDGAVSPADSAPVADGAIDQIEGSPVDDSGDNDDSSPPRRLMVRAKEGLEKRQTTFCCRPSPVQCLLLDNGLPTCYVRSASHLFFTSRQKSVETDLMPMTGSFRHPLLLSRRQLLLRLQQHILFCQRLFFCPRSLRHRERCCRLDASSPWYPCCCDC